jgi:MFS transporter, ACS family, hexuronate transporter
MQKHWRWLIVGLLFLATLLNYLDRQTLSVTASKILDEFKLNDADLGTILFGFFLSYGIAQLFIGPFLDRLNIKFAYALAVAAWSIAGAAAVFATGFWSLFFLRILLGICESPNWPLALRVVARNIPPDQRSLANGVFQSGTSIGALIAGPLIIFLTNLYGWRFSFIVMGAVGFLWVALWLLFFRSDVITDEADTNVVTPTSVGTVGTQNQESSPSTVGQILKSRIFWGLIIATCFLNPLQYFYITWLPRYFEKYAGVGFGTELASRLTIVYLALDLGLLTGGTVVILLSRKFEVRNARKIVVAIGAALMMTIPFVSQLRDINHVTAFICLATFGLGWFMVNYLAFTSEVSAKKTSTAAGLLGGAGSLAGAGFMILVGQTVEKNKSFDIAFLMAGLMPLIAFIGILISTYIRKGPGQLDVREPQVQNA